MNILRAKARVLISLPFMIDGFDAMRNPDPHAEKFLRAWSSLEAVGAPAVSADRARLMARVSGLITLGAGLSLSLGKHQRAAAFTLAAATIPVAVANAPVWLAGDRKERRVAGRKLVDYGALLGGLSFVVLDRRGKPSRKWRKHYRVEQRGAVRAAVEETLANVHKTRS